MRFFDRHVLLNHPNGDRSDYIPPCGCFEFDFEVPERDFPVTHSFRLIGEPDFFWKFRTEPGSPYSISMNIDDALTSQDTYQETFALEVDCGGVPYSRNAWVKLFKKDIITGKFTFSIPVKKHDLHIPAGAAAGVELEFYHQKNGRHENDTFDEPDDILKIDFAAGTADWEVLSKEFTMQDNVCAVLCHIYIDAGVSGKLRLGSPRLTPAGMDNILPPFARIQDRYPEYNYVSDNFSRRDHIEFICEIDGKTVFDGQKYTSIVRRMDHEFSAGELNAGKHHLKITFKNDYENAVGFVIQQLDLVEQGNHEFELIAAPEFVPAGEECKILLKCKKDGVTVSDGKKQYPLTGKGLQVISLPPPDSDEEVITISSGNFSDYFTIKKSIPAAAEEKVYLSTGDSVFIPREMEDMERFIEWYCGNNIGNAICFRQSYRWGGSRYVNTGMWQTILPLLKELGISYMLMIDGRELPGCDANPPESIMRGPAYLGRQSHENDGSLYYWGNQLWKSGPPPEPYADLLAKRVNFGGIQPHSRPARNGKNSWWFFDPTDAENMKQAAEIFVGKLAGCRGESTRHSGPSTLFRYFFQAGYDFLLAEQMYGPEELTLASLRAASKTYKADGFGSHLATQWSSTPHDTPDHAERYYLSLATCYIQGVTQINTEEGLWRMEKGFADHDRFSRNSRRHLDAHSKFRRFLETHPRSGKIVVPIACIQGRYDAWCAKRISAWKREGDMWDFGDAEKSFDLLKLFYPRSVIDWIYRCPCEVAPQGWYTGTPYGPVDLLPVEGNWQDYRVIIFLGWHTYLPEDGVKMLEFVKNGGTLLLTRRHLSSSLIHNGEAQYADDPALKELLGDWQHASRCVTRQIGKGEVIFFADDNFPAADGLREKYIAAMQTAAEKATAAEAAHLWAKGSEDVNFAVYEQPNGERTIYALNINWWEHKIGNLEIICGNQSRTQEIPAVELMQI